MYSFIDLESNKVAIFETAEEADSFADKVFAYRVKTHGICRLSGFLFSDCVCRNPNSAEEF